MCGISDFHAALLDFGRTGQQRGTGVADFTVEIAAQPDQRIAQLRAQAVAFSAADFADPPVLQNQQGAAEYAQRPREQPGQPALRQSLHVLSLHRAAASRSWPAM